MSTKRQHYIPRMILRNHTIPFRLPQRKNVIWQYDKIKQIERIVSIDDVCWEKNLYEIKDDSGQILKGTRNEIERNFSIIESAWNRVFLQIINHRGINPDDEYLVYLFFALQMLRMPNAIKSIENCVKHINPKLSIAEATRYARMASFLCGPITAENHIFLDNALSLFSQKYICVFESNQTLVIGGNTPILSLPPLLEDDWNRYIFLFPLSRFQYLVLTPGKPPKFYIQMPDKWFHFMNSQVFDNESRFIYASMRPSEIANMKF